MYLRVTSRCNMKCDHCGFSCGERGTDMAKDVFMAALEMSAERGDTITLGGGEPTLHPQFWEFIGLALSKTDSETMPFIVTNGKITEIAIALANLAKRGVIGAALSQDPWHDRIEPEVIQAFTRTKRNMFSYDQHDVDYREIRNVSDR